MTSVWGGMDGWYQFPGANDVLQAGVTISTCNPTSQVQYQAWYEWWNSQCYNFGNLPPCSMQNVSLTVNPGDWVYIRVAYYTSGSNNGNNGYNGYAFISNQTTGKYYPPVQFNEAAPINSTTLYQGANAEWIVERPSWNNVTTDLANYSGHAGPSGTEVWLAADYGTNSTGAWSIGYGSESTISVAYMTCPPWNPISNCSSLKWGTELSVGVYYPPNPNGGYYGVFAYPTGPVVQQ